MSFLYDRIAKVIIGTTETQGLVFDERFRIAFTISKTSTSNPTVSSISIYNLSDTDRKKIENIPKENISRTDKGEKPFIIVLFAGYKEGNGYELLYQGNIVTVNTEYTPPNYITKITCSSGLLPLTNATLQLSYNAGINTNSIISQIADALKTDISKASDYLDTNKSFANGYNYSGLAKNALDEITKEAGLKWSIENGKLLITKINKPTLETVVAINKDSGLIGIPSKISNQQTGSTTDQGDYTGWNFKSLLQPKISLNRKIKLESKFVEGIFIVDSVTHKGDTRGKEWISEVQTRVPQ